MLSRPTAARRDAPGRGFPTAAAKAKKDLPELAATSTSPWRRILPGLTLFGLACVVYIPALWQGYIWDDDHYVTQNPNLDDFAGLWRIWFSPEASPQYYPFVFTSFWVEKKLWLLDPAGFHAVNVLLHATSVVLVWRLLDRLAVPGAWWAAALFAVHPVHVESVVWITERKNVLSGALYLTAMLAMFAWTRAMEAPDEASSEAPHELAARRASARRSYALALLAFGGALLSKSVTATFPAAFLLLRWMQTGRVRPRDVVATIPFFVLGLAAGMHTAYLEVTHVGAGGSEFDLSLVERLLLMCRTSWFYLQKLVVPWPIMFFYPRWQIDAADARLWAYAAATIGLFVALILLRKRLGRGPLTGVLFFAGTILPASGLFNVYPFRFSFVADHFQYLASLGILATLAGLVAGWAGRERTPEVARKAALAAGVLILATFAAITVVRIPVYRDALTLWEDTVAQNPGSGGAWLNVGDRRLERGDLDGAESAYLEAIELDFDPDTANLNLALVELRRGNVEAATRRLERALELDPQEPTAWLSYGNLAYSQGDLVAARERYLRSAEIKSTFLAQFSLGAVAFEQKDYAEAVKRFRLALDRESLPREAEDARINLRLAEKALAAEKEQRSRAAP